MSKIILNVSLNIDIFEFHYECIRQEFELSLYFPY